MAVYLVKGARDNVLGNISDAGPFRIFLNTDGTSDEPVSYTHLTLPTKA